MVEVVGHADKDLKSLNCDVRSRVVFISNTDRPVELLWVDYAGKLVRYSLLERDCRYWVQTFVSHPWVFRDADSGDGLVGNQKAVFWPHDNEFSENYFQVNIGIPVYPLLECCLQQVDKMCAEDHIADLDIPAILKLELKQRKKRCLKDAAEENPS